MDILRPPLHWIGNRCYRRNTNNVRLDDNLPQIYDEEGEPFNDVAAVCSVDETCDVADSTCDIEHNPQTGQYVAKLVIASAYFGSVIGRQGETKRRMESQTNCKILVPKMGQDGEIVVTGWNTKEVASCCRRIEMLVEGARLKQPFTHFVSIPLNSNEIVANFKDFQQKVISQCGQSRGVSPSLLQDPKRLHLTLGTLVLLSQEERKKATRVLNDANAEIIKPFLDQMNGQLTLHVSELEYMNDDPGEVDVLYAKVSLSDAQDNVPLATLVEKLVNYFIAHGLMRRQYERVKLHATVMNTLFRDTDAEREVEASDPNSEQQQRRRREHFDARDILLKFKNFDFGKQQVHELHISQRHAFDRNGYYYCTGKVEF